MDVLEVACTSSNLKTFDDTDLTESDVASVSNDYKILDRFITEVDKPDNVDNPNSLKEISQIETVTDTLDVSTSLKNSPSPVIRRKRGRPRKGTKVARSSTINPSPSIKHRNKRKGDDEDDDIDQALSEVGASGKSKRRRHPKVLNDYVTDFDSSDEEVLDESEWPKNKSGFGRRQTKRNDSNAVDNDDILSLYLNHFELDASNSEFLENVHEICEEDDDAGCGGKYPSSSASVGGSHNAKLLHNESNKDVDPSNGKDIFSPVGADKDVGHINRDTSQQAAALQQKCRQLLSKLQNRSQFTKVVDLLHGASRFLTDEQLVFFTLQLKSNCKTTQGIRFTVREKILALAIYAHSPETYKFLQSIFFLPSKIILDRWLEAVAKNNPLTAKRLIYYIFNKFLFS